MDLDEIYNLYITISSNFMFFNDNKGLFIKLKPKDEY